jgi:2-dehydropantoate 2-reductase
MEATAHIFKDGAVCSVQNGVGAEEIIAQYVPRVILGTTFPAGHITEPGVCNQDTGGSTWIGPFEPKPASMAEVEQLADACNRAGLNVLAMADARGAQWTKLIFNSASNAMGALTRLAHGVACDQPEVRSLMSGLAQEGIAVANKLGITLDSDPEKLIDHGREVAYHHKPSMLQDVLAERVTEVDALNAAIARLGKEVGVDCPLNEAVSGMIRGLEHSWTQQA